MPEVGTGLLDTYRAALTLDVASTDRVNSLIALATVQSQVESTMQAFQVDDAGVVLQDLTPYLSRDTNAEISWDSASNVSGSCVFGISGEAVLTWGSSRVKIYQLLRSTEYNVAHGLDIRTWLRFPVGVYIVTSPGTDDLDASATRRVTGYTREYLLQSQAPDSLSFAFGSTYLAAITAVFAAAGVSISLLTYPGSWSTKTLPAPRNFPLDDSTTMLDIVNELLQGSGCLPLYTDQDGFYKVTTTPKPTTQALLWRWAASADTTLTDADLDVKVVRYRGTGYQGDVWNVPNQWVFIQQGLTFEPIEGSGKYTVNNTTIPPSDQVTVGRVIRDTQFLPVSGQTDLVTQGDAIVTAALSQAEKISLQTRAWPAAGHYDVFQVTHKSFPFSSVRRVQASSWRLPLWGGPMNWQTNAVAQL